MATLKYTSTEVPFSDRILNGGLNSKAGPLGLRDNESSDLVNIDFDKFGSILQRNGYTVLNPTQTNGSTTSYGLHWYETNLAGTTTRFALNIGGSTSNYSRLYKMDSLDGIWDDVTGNVTIPNEFCDFTNFLNEVYVTAPYTAPFKWTGGGNASLFVTTPANLQWAKYNEEFNNYLFLANVKVEGTYHNSRFYWSEIKNTAAWTATNFMEVAKDDGQEITRIKKLGDRLVVYKTRSIYNVFFTGDSTVPFILPGGGKSNSPVGCVAPFSVQEVDNGHVFLSYDGLYFYDGLNSYKISDRISDRIITNFKSSQFVNAQSLVQKDKNRYWCTFTNTSSTTNAELIVWDYFNNAFSHYKGMEPSSMATFYVNGDEERPYFCDYKGWCYRADTGIDDYPANVTTAISSHYYTNWRSFGDLVDKKGIPHIVIYHQITDSILTLAYSYDLETGDQHTQTFSLATSGDVYDTAEYDDATYAKEGGDIHRRDLTGRGRLVRLKFANSKQGETFQIDGIGTMAYLESKI